VAHLLSSTRNKGQTTIKATDPIQWDENLLILRDMYGDANLRSADVFTVAQEEANGQRSTWVSKPILGGESFSRTSST
jgi:hypothetical protein